MKKLCCLFVLLVMDLSAQSRKTIYDTVFAVGDMVLLPEVRFSTDCPKVFTDTAITQIAAFLNSHKGLRCEMGMHTDTRGNKESNRLLSEARGQSVFNELTYNYRVDKSQLSIKGYGSSTPLISDEEISKAKTKQEKEALHTMNRRIELKILDIK